MNAYQYESKPHGREGMLLMLAYLATALLTLIPFCWVGFTTGDDLQYFQTAQRSWGDWMGDARAYAEGQGRFYFLITKVFYYIPYLLDNFVYAKVVQYVTLVASYVVGAHFVYRLFRSWRLGLIMLLLMLVDTAITANNHIATIAYPFYFSFSFILFVGAMLIHLNYRQRGGGWRLVVAALLMLFAFLFYEMYLLFAAVFVVALVATYWREMGLRSMLRSRRFWGEIVPYIVVALVYVGCYFGYRRWLLATQPEVQFYGGATFAAGAFSLEGFFRVLWRCTRGVLPWQYYADSQSLMRDNSLLIGGHTNNLWRVLTHAPVVVWINALLQAVVLWFVARGLEHESLPRRKVLLGIMVSLFLAFFAHTLIGITPKYNQEWSQWMRGYVTSFFSMFALMTAFALLIVGTHHLFRSLWGQRLVRLFWCAAIFLLSLLTGYSNHHVGREWAKSQHRFTLIDAIGRQGGFDALPDNAVLYIEELQNTSWVAYDISKGQVLGQYINMRAGRSFGYATSFDELQQLPAGTPLVYLHAAETQKAGELLVSIALIDGGSGCQPDSLAASKAEVYYYSPAKRYTLFYQSAGRWCAVPFFADSHTQRITHLTVADSAINPRSLVVSDMLLPQPTDEQHE